MVALNVTPQIRPVHTRAVPFSALLVACLLAVPAWAKPAPKPAPDATHQIHCITAMGSAKDVAAAIMQQANAVPVMTMMLNEDMALVIFASPSGEGWAEVALDITKAQACVIAAGPAWNPMSVPSAAPSRPAKPRPPGRRMITPVQPEESI